jgi:ParB-like nuclease domain
MMDAATPRPDLDTMRRELEEARHAMRAAIEARDVPEIECVFLRAHQILTDAQVLELRYKREKNIESQRRYWEIALGVERLRGQWLTDTEKKGLRYIRPKNTKFGAPTGFIMLDAPGQPPRIGIERKKSQDLQAFARLTEQQFQAELADKTKMLTVAGILRLYAPKSTGDGVNPGGGEKRTVSLDVIRADERAQPRAALDEDQVSEYVEAMARGETFPRLVLFQDKKGRYWLADGFHRFQAAVELKRKAIECIVYQGELRDATLFSCGANATHGLPRTNADKRQAVTKLLSDDKWAAWSDSEIARRCHVSDHLVATIRKQLAPVHHREFEDRPRTVSRGGTTYTQETANIGRSRAPNPASGKGSSEEGPEQPQSALPPQESPELAPEPVPEPASEPVKEPAPADDDALAQELAPASKPDPAPTAPDQSASTEDPWAHQRAAVRGFIVGLKSVDLGQMFAAPMPVEELRDAKEVVSALSAALDAAIDRATQDRPRRDARGRKVGER